MAWLDEHEMKIVGGPSREVGGVSLDQQWWLGNPMGNVPQKMTSCSNCGKDIEIPLKSAMQLASMLCRDCNPDFQNSKCAQRS